MKPSRARKPKNFDVDTEIHGGFIWLRGYKALDASTARQLAWWLLRAAAYLDARERERGRSGDSKG